MSCSKNDNIKEEKIISVECITPQEKLFENIIKVFGNIEPVEYADISARIEGVLERRFVNEGEKFKKGEVLFQIDKVKAENKFKSAEEELKVAEANLKKAQLDLEILRITLDKANLDYQRAKELIQQQAISQDRFENYELNWKKTHANFNQAEAIVAISVANRDRAKTNLEIARKELNDSSEMALFDGVVTTKYKEEGEFLKIGDKVIRIQNDENLEAVAYLSSEFYPYIKPGETIARIKSGNVCEEEKISYKSADIDTKTRTFKIKIKIPPNKNFISGSLCLIEIITERKNAIGIPSNTILEKNKGVKTIFKINNNIAEEIEVKTGIEHGDMVEIVEPEIRNLKIVSEGQALLASGDKVKIISESK
ncbi:MAG TPA: efflux RND transporter periplasmic adaptor subunit [Victivallales bacterium]|nr:efflux RND transporter periplasmic adaptor subunit [Victivallales bacterium]HPO90267.1 efflux RND transporter periplasmic adaptor subunit [Victivallales bacterium]HRU02453.1 efflux RND transporter periplasmic adaptor subunit [Victivallales bacterium]